MTNFKEAIAGIEAICMSRGNGTTKIEIEKKQSKLGKRQAQTITREQNEARRTRQRLRA